jgi:hypothetical protein
MKRQLEVDNSALRQNIETANERHARDQETIADLSGNTRNLDSPRTSTGIGGELETELEGSKEQEQQFIDLKSKNRQLAKSMEEADANITRLQENLDHATERCVEMEKKYLETLEQKMSLESSLSSRSEKFNLPIRHARHPTDDHLSTTSPRKTPRKPNPPTTDAAANEELHKLADQMKAATISPESAQSLDDYIASLSNTIMESRERMAQKQQVQQSISYIGLDSFDSFPMSPMPRATDFHKPK